MTITTMNHSRIYTILIIAALFNVQLTSSLELDITSDSDIGRHILSSARRLDGGEYNNNNSYYWMAAYSLKFLGCHTILGFNFDVDNDNDVRIQKDRLVRFRLCPSKSCSSSSSRGCGKGYGDYIVDVDTYVSAYVEAQRRQDEYECSMYLNKHCSCQESDDKDDGFDYDLCKYKCFQKAKKYDCIEVNPYYDDDGGGSYSHLYRNDLRDFEKYFQGCSQFQPNENMNNNEDASYYIGSYCADQGGKIYLGMFTDDTCTNFADKNAGRSTYKYLTSGMELPFSDYSIVRPDCIACAERDRRQQAENSQKADSEVRLSNACIEVYQAAGKCETKIYSDHGPQSKNENGCYYMEGIKLVRKDGLIDTSLTRPNKTISFFIFLFSVSFVLLGAFIYYLRMSKYSFIHIIFFPCNYSHIS
jgi:hypothetical protein